MKRRVTAILLLAASIGCQGPQPSKGPMATDVDPAQGQPDYWLAQQPTVNVSNRNFDKLWNSAEHVSESLLFAIDRRDRRTGLLTTQPNESAQWFEPWRQELQTGDDVLNSSAAAYRRIIYWQFEQQGGGYTVTPKVLVQRQSLSERRITGVLNRGYFQRATGDHYYGTKETDEGIILPQNYWYPVGRDFALEKKLTAMMRDQLQG